MIRNVFSWSVTIIWSNAPHRVSGGSKDIES